MPHWGDSGNGTFYASTWSGQNICISHHDVLFVFCMRGGNIFIVERSEQGQERLNISSWNILLQLNINETEHVEQILQFSKHYSTESCSIKSWFEGAIACKFFPDHFSTPTPILMQWNVAFTILHFHINLLSLKIKIWHYKQPGLLTSFEFDQQGGLCERRLWQI